MSDGSVDCRREGALSGDTPRQPPHTKSHVIADGVFAGQAARLDDLESCHRRRRADGFSEYTGADTPLAHGVRHNEVAGALAAAFVERGLGVAGGAREQGPVGRPRPRGAPGHEVRSATAGPSRRACRSCPPKPHQTQRGERRGSLRGRGRGAELTAAGCDLAGAAAAGGAGGGAGMQTPMAGIAMRTGSGAQLGLRRALPSAPTFR